MTNRTQYIADTLREFIESTLPVAMVLQGAWGRGKTHLWKAVWKEYLGATRSHPAQRIRCSYVSLFGLNSIQELKLAIYASHEEIESVTVQEVSWPRRLGFWANRSKSQAHWLAEQGDTLGLGNTLSSIYSAVAGNSIRNMLICFDDIERRGADLRLLDFLGYASNLVAERNCRVLVILNNHSLGESEATWEAQKEKVFSREISFAPTSKECIEIVFPTPRTSEMHEHLARSLELLEVSNIRILARARSLVDNLGRAAFLGELPPQIRKQIAQSLGLIVFCHSGAGEGAPSLEFLRRWQSVMLKDSRSLSGEEQRWAKQLSAYGYRFDSDLDSALLESITQGFFDNEALHLAAEIAAHRLVSAEQKEQFFEAWNLFHYSYNDNKADVVNAFELAFRSGAQFISSCNADSTIVLMRELDRDDLATLFIDCWISAHSREGSADLSPDHVRRFGQLRDREFADAIEEAYAAASVLLPLDSAMRALGSQEGYRKEAIYAVASVDPAELTTYLRNHSGERFTSEALRTCLGLSGEARSEAAKSCAIQALKLIAASSSFEDFRVRKAFPEVFEESPGDAVY